MPSTPFDVCKNAGLANVRPMDCAVIWKPINDASFGNGSETVAVPAVAAPVRSPMIVFNHKLQPGAGKPTAVSGRPTPGVPSPKKVIATGEIGSTFVVVKSQLTPNTGKLASSASRVPLIVTPDERLADQSTANAGAAPRVAPNSGVCHG